MALNQNRVRKPVIFGRKNTKKDKVEDDDTLDMLLHYAKAGMEHAERSLLEKPDMFTPEERRAFEQNKNMLEQAPYLIESYKSKMNEYDALYKKMVSILKKCEEIVAAGDDQAKGEIKKVLDQAKVFSYSDDGDLVMKREA